MKQAFKNILVLYTAFLLFLTFGLFGFRQNPAQAVSYCRINVYDFKISGTGQVKNPYGNNPSTVEGVGLNDAISYSGSIYFDDKNKTTAELGAACASALNSGGTATIIIYDVSSLISKELRSIQIPITAGNPGPYNFNGSFVLSQLGYMERVSGNYIALKAGTFATSSDKIQYRKISYSDGTTQTITLPFVAGSVASGGGGNSGQPTVSIAGGAKSQYAVGETITLTAQNIPADAKVQIYIGNDAFGGLILGSQLANYSFKIDDVNFAVGEDNDLSVVVTAKDGTVLIDGNTPISSFKVVPAGTTPPTGDPSNPNNPAAVDCSGPNPDPNFCIYNPLPVNSLTETLLLIMRGFLAVIGIWSVAFIVIGGFRYVMSQGDEEAVTTARKTITWAVVGFAIAMLAFAIMAIVQNVLQTRIKDVTTKTSNIQVYKTRA